MRDKDNKPEKVSSIDPQILGKILVLQAGLNAIPNPESLADYLCRGLEITPGTCFVAVRIIPFEKFSNDKHTEEVFANDFCKLCNQKLPGENINGFSTPGKHHEKYFCIRVQTLYENYGCLFFEKSNGKELEPYQPFLENLANTVALTLEIRNHEGTLKQVNAELMHIKEGLETLVQERTKELTLRNEELQRWAHIFEHAEWGVTVGSADGKTFELMNPAFARMIGYTIDELKGKPWLSVFALEVRADVPINIELAHEEGHHIWESVYLRKDGSCFPVLIDVTAVRDKHGEVLYRVFNVQDITERKQAEDALRASERGERERAAELQTIMDTVPAAVSIAHDQMCQVIIGNRALYDLLRMPSQSNTSLTAPPDQRPSHFKIFIDGIQPPPNELPLQVSAATGVKIRGIEEDVVFDDSRVVHLLGNVVPLFDEQGQSRGAIAAFVDITERKLAEEHIQVQLERLRALHNIDNAIKSNVDLNTTLKIFLDEVTTQLKVDAASVLLFNKDTLTLEHAASYGFHSAVLQYTKLEFGEGYAGSVILDGKTIYIPDLTKTESKLAEVLSLAGENFTAYVGFPLIAKSQIVGVLEIFHRSPLAPDPDWFDFLDTLAGQAAIAIDNARLFESLQHSNFELTFAYDATIEGWSRALDLRDKETEGHTQRVATLTVKLAQQMGIPEVELIHIRRGALLHDIGKMGIPDSILLKPDKLTLQEWDRMRQHTIYAYEMLHPIIYLRPALDIPRYHHEKWDGTGYPYKLTGEDIPLPSRIFAVVDVWDAVTSDRPYRSAWSKEKALEYIKSESGKHFDPAVVEAFLTLISREE